MALAVYGGNKVSVLLGEGDGTFLPAQTFPGGGISVAVGDFNGDGWPDLAVTDGGSNTVAILINDRHWRARPGRPTASPAEAARVYPGALDLDRQVTVAPAFASAHEENVPQSLVPEETGAILGFSAMQPQPESFQPQSTGGARQGARLPLPARGAGRDAGDMLFAELAGTFSLFSDSAD